MRDTASRGPPLGDDDAEHHLGSDRLAHAGAARLGGHREQDKNLARQLRDSASSVVGNLGEGENRRGGHQRERFETAYGSAGEARVWLLAAAGLGYVSQETVAPLADWADKARAVTWKMMH